MYGFRWVSIIVYDLNERSGTEGIWMATFFVF